jgi:hypothetical protein
MFDASIIEVGGQEFDVEKEDQIQSLINQLNKMIGGVEGVKSVGDQADELLSKYGKKDS